MNARRGFLMLAGLAPLLVVAPADAGSYLNRAAMLVIQGSRESQYLRGRVNDKDLAALGLAIRSGPSIRQTLDADA